MKKILFATTLNAVLFMQFGCTAVQFPEGKLSVKVVDQSGTAVSNVTAKAYFYEASSSTRDYVSDSNGVFVVQGRCDRSIGGRVEKNGYYKGGFGYGWGPDGINKALNRWEPWNPTVTAVMKKIRNPVPMKHLTGWKRPKIPEFGKPIGFDLEEGDWVFPYGSGIHADFIFTANEIPDVIAGISLHLSFINEFDGIQEYLFDPQDHSRFKWPYEAPDGGYTNRWSRYAKKFLATFDYSEFYPGKDYKEMVTRLEDNLKEDGEVNYIFRVRSVVDEKGNLVRACYGKIEGEIKVSPNGGLHFRYWFNPDWTPNLEDDPMKNWELD
ncbi:hypothetical protein [Tichowtungia aerotolerans]|uniref:Carboxypeptidase regulatory-like domain-containing protein n=1 Tax=Tichowtungia aerotolerans TaxID=2697043 RepID=A0A6P1M4T3_9BACT|nr:hypothetical protein [Tichowtungia aerotolerans]QHI69062.1 hypothetical protein GT409_06255 [Tichowtungia aerotolerans]